MRPRGSVPVPTQGVSDTEVALVGCIPPQSGLGVLAFASRVADAEEVPIKKEKPFYSFLSSAPDGDKKRKREEDGEEDDAPKPVQKRYGKGL